MPSLDRRQTTGVVAIALLMGLSLLYAIVVMQSIRIWLSTWLGIASLAATAFVIYLLWRFVRAHERIASALEADDRDVMAE